MPNTKYGARLRKWMETNGKRNAELEGSDESERDLTRSTVDTVNAVEPGLDTPPVSTERPGDDTVTTTTTPTRATARKSTTKRATTTKATAKKTTPAKRTSAKGGSKS